MFITETWVTFVFLSVIMGVKYHSAAKDLQLNCFMIGLTLSANILVSANTTGASLNPAVGLVLPIFSKLTNSEYTGIKFIWIWTLGPILGGILAACRRNRLANHCPRNMSQHCGTICASRCSAEGGLGKGGTRRSAQTDMILTIFGSTELMIGPSKAKNCEEIDFEVRCL